MGPSWADRTQVGPMLAPWILLSGFDLSWPSPITLTYCTHLAQYIFVWICNSTSQNIKTCSLYPRQFCGAKPTPEIFNIFQYDCTSFKKVTLCYDNAVGSLWVESIGHLQNKTNNASVLILDVYASLYSGCYPKVAVPCITSRLVPRFISGISWGFVGNAAIYFLTEMCGIH